LKLPRSVETAEVDGKVVLVRADLNVPLDEGRVADDTRIRASLPTLQLLLARGAAELRVCSHLGRPKGRDDAFAIEPVRQRLNELLADDRLNVLENTRFDERETANDPSFAQELAAGCDLFVTGPTPRRRVWRTCCLPMPGCCCSTSYAISARCSVTSRGRS
jgi:phosphoglycerate kinase